MMHSEQETLMEMMEIIIIAYDILALLMLKIN